MVLYSIIPIASGYALKYEIIIPKQKTQNKNKAKLKKVCGSTNMDIFFTGGRADFFFLIYFLVHVNTLYTRIE